MNGPGLKAPTTDLPNAPFGGKYFLDSERFRELSRRQSYYDCTQHDSKRYDFDGRIIQSGGPSTQPLLSAERAPYFVPLRSRRPSSPYRLGRAMVNAFTNMVFGQSRFPKLIIEGDSDSEDFLQTLVKVAGLPVKCIRSRSLGGATGTSTMSWCYLEGKPRFEVHNAKNIFVHSWEDREQFMVKHATECFQFPKDEWNPEKKRFERVLYWYRRDWTPDADIMFKHVKVESGAEPFWTPNVEKSVVHNDHLTHFNWIQNLPSDEQDGKPDYEGLYETFDALDLLYSVINRGATLNLDPTLMLKMDPELVTRMGVKKGSDNALIVGKDGEAKYLELGGTSITAGLALFESKRKSALETGQCVMPDPHDTASQGVSSVTMKLVYAPMLGKTDVIREQWADGLKRLLEPMMTVARHASKTVLFMFDKDGNETQYTQEVILPPKIEKTPKEDDDGLPTGEEDVESTPREPGEGGEIECQWGPYFEPTPMDQSQIVTTLSLAVAAAPIMSAETATEIVMKTFGREEGDEKAKMAKAKKAADDKAAEMMPPGGAAFGGKPGGGKPPPFGGPPKPFGGPPKGPPGSIVAGGDPPPPKTK